MVVPTDPFRCMFIGRTVTKSDPHEERSELAAIQQVIADGGGTDAFEFEVLFHPIAKLTHGGSPW
jgi:hypothetical protein